MNANCAGALTPERRLSLLFAYIEEHICDDVTLDELAAAGGVSKFQLTRLFSRVCGSTPMDYVRARRLARSIPALLEGGRVLDVALDYGFSFEQSYIRAFSAAYGVTPARFRKRQSPVPITEVPVLEGLTLSAAGMLGRPQRLYRPAFELSGAVRTYNYADNMLRGAPLLEGLARRTGGLYTAACRPMRAGSFAHDYLVAGDGGGAPRTWRYGAGEWAMFRYIGLHGLDAEGAQRFRLLAALVVQTWFDEHKAYWGNGFIETVDSAWLGEDYCEVELLCPLF